MFFFNPYSLAEAPNFRVEDLIFVNLHLLLRIHAYFAVLLKPKLRLSSKMTTTELEADFSKK